MSKNPTADDAARQRELDDTEAWLLKRLARMPLPETFTLEQLLTVETEDE